MHRQVQIHAISFVDGGTQKIEDVINAGVLMNQIGIFVKMPGTMFKEEARLAISAAWQKIPWSNINDDREMKMKTAETNFMDEEWRLEKGANHRMTTEAEIIEVGIQESFIDFVQNTQNVNINSNKFGCINGNLDLEDGVQIESIVGRSAEEIRMLANFVPMEEEIIMENLLKYAKTPANEIPSSDIFKRKVNLGKYVAANFADICKSRGVFMPALFKAPARDSIPTLSLKTPLGTLGNAMVSRPELLKETTVDFNINPETGGEIVPGKALVMKLPAVGPDESIKVVLKNLETKVNKILNHGWEPEKTTLNSGFSQKDKSVPNVKPKGPKIKTSFVEESVRPKQQSPEKQHSEENILVVLEHWRCVTCTPMAKRMANHRMKGGCFDSLPPREQKKIRAALQRGCDEAKEERLKKEMIDRKVVEDRLNNMENTEEAQENSIDKDKPNESVEETNIEIHDTEEIPREEIVEDVEIPEAETEAETEWCPGSFEDGEYVPCQARGCPNCAEYM